jgi:hypothetical protein
MFCAKAERVNSAEKINKLADFFMFLLFRMCFKIDSKTVQMFT